MSDNENKPLVVFTGPDHSAKVVEEVLGEWFDVCAVEPTPESLLPQFKRCHAFLDASMKVPLSGQDIAEAENLKLIVTATTGATHIDGSALEARNIPLLTLKGQKQILQQLTPAAELSWALVMACARQLPKSLQHVHDAGWDRTLFPGMMLKGKRIGLIGMGRIGGWMARYANAFGMDICYYDPMQSEAPEYAQSVSLEELVSTSDVISIHVHVTEETGGMVDKALISKFKPGSIFVNTSRGELTDEAALVDALEEGRIAAVGVDVLVGEPEIEKNVLWQYAQDHSNVLITPHIGGFCPNAVDQVVEFSARRIQDHFGK